MSRAFAKFFIKFLLFISAVRCLVANFTTSEHKYEIDKINTKLEDIQDRLNDFLNKYLVHVVNQGETGNKTINLPASCSEAFDPKRGSGIYHIYLPESRLQPFAVYCLKDEQYTQPWTVFQRRVDNTTDFQRNWKAYKLGFGDMNGNFWIGLDKLHALTSDPNNPQELWIQLQDNVTADARYSRFVIGNEFEFYNLKELGDFVGTAGDSLRIHAGMNFSTYDYDNDAASDANCAARDLGAWWYNNCGFKSNLNGLYGHKSEGVYWHSFRNYTSMTFAQMAIRPV